MVDVLLATYQPDPEFLNAQVDSIHAQKDVNVNLICREDTEGLGACGNFSALLRESKAAYVAFADQDDVWLPDKLTKCRAKLQALEAQYGRDTPLAVFCDGWVTDADLRRAPGTVISRQGVNVEKGLAFSRLLMQNFIAGNAMLFNAALRAKAGHVPREALMHDIWLVLVAAAFGHIAFVDEPLYLYRQHGRNALGATAAGTRHVVARTTQGVPSFRARLAANIRQAQAFVDRFGAEAPAAAHALARLSQCGWLQRRKVLFSQKLWKQGFARNLALALFV